MGSFATVHRAHDPVLDDTVVVKVLAENHSLNPDVRERFITEGRLQRRIRSEHVVGVHDLGETDHQQPYLVLEEADRGSLGARVEARRRAGWSASTDDLLVVARDLAAALGAVHAARVVHRDLSPANVLLRSWPADRPGAGARHRQGPPRATLLEPDERLLLSDLGLCKDLAVNSGLTVGVGTRGFRAPEMDAPAGVVDHRTDLWSLSALVTWVAGDAELPQPVVAALRRGCATDPDDRPADVQEWLRELETALAPRTTPSPTPPAPEGASRRELLRGLVPAGAGVVGAVAGAVLWPRLTQPGDTHGAARVEVSGPAEVAVGERAAFVLDHSDVTSWVWELPDGRFVSGRRRVVLTPRGAGRARVVVRATTTDGAPLVTTHHLRVTP